MPLLDLGGIVGPVRSRVGKDPAFFRGHSSRAPLQNDLGQGRMQRNIVLGVFGLDVIHPAVHKAALNEKLVFVEIEVVPLKRRDLADAKTEALGCSSTWWLDECFALFSPFELSLPRSQ